MTENKFSARLREAVNNMNAALDKMRDQLRNIEHKNPAMRKIMDQSDIRNVANREAAEGRDFVRDYARQVRAELGLREDGGIVVRCTCPLEPCPAKQRDVHAEWEQTLGKPLWIYYP